MLPIGATPGRFVSQQSIHLANSAANNKMQQQLQQQQQQSVGKNNNSQKYIPPNKKNATNFAKNGMQSKQTEQNKQGPYNKVLIVGLSQDYRSLNGVLSKYNN